MKTVATFVAAGAFPSPAISLRTLPISKWALDGELQRGRVGVCD